MLSFMNLGGSPSLFPFKERNVFNCNKEQEGHLDIKKTYHVIEMHLLDILYL